MDKEYRNINIEVRKNDEGMISGYALTFNQPYDIAGYVEEIASSSVEGVIERSDIFALLNHDPNRGILARSLNGKGSLKLSVDDTGLAYEFKSGKSALHQELREYIERGEVTASSFAFTVAEGGEKWEKMGDGKYKRTITQFQNLFDISPVFQPANASTSVSARSLEKLNELKVAEALAAKEAEARLAEDKAKDEKFNAYYKQLLKNYL